MTSSAPPPASRLARRLPARRGARDRAGDALALAGARVGVSPRAVVGLLLVVALILTVLGGRVLLARQRSVPEVIAPASLVQGPGRTAATGPTGPTGTSSPTSKAPVTVPVVVHVVGQVRKPGVVRLVAGARVQQALTAAGGALRTADLERVNLARLVVDGEQILVPRPGEAVVSLGGAAPGGGTPGGSAGAAVIDLNTAALTELDSLPGVGPVLAQRILDWRTANGRFTSIDELGEVSGIGDAVLTRLRPRVRV